MSESENKELDAQQEKKEPNTKQVSINNPSDFPQESKSNKNKEIVEEGALEKSTTNFDSRVIFCKIAGRSYNYMFLDIRGRVFSLGSK